MSNKRKQQPAGAGMGDGEPYGESEATQLLERIYRQGWEEGVRRATADVARVVREAQAEAWETGYEAGFSNAADDYSYTPRRDYFVNPYRGIGGGVGE